MTHDYSLFTIKKQNLETGLRGIPIGYCTTSTVDPYKGLFYCGYPIAKLISLTVEEVIYLLIFGNRGSLEDVQKFFKKINANACLDSKTVQAIQKLPREGHPMKLLSAALLILGIIEGKHDYREDYFNIVAKAPHLIATVINHHTGWGQTPDPKDKLDYIENFIHMIKIPSGEKNSLKDAFTLFNIVHYDHGGGNLSTFVGKAVASGLEDMYGSLSAAMNALAGPRHGKANQDCLEFIQEILKNLGENPSSIDIERFIRNRLANRQLVFGFGHAVLRVEDSRASVVYDYLKKHYPEESLVKVALLLREVGPRVLSENPKISNPYPNIDAVSGTLLAVSGFNYPKYFTVLFGLSRMVGIGRQILYERLEAREGKGTPIMRPKYLYSGPALQ